MYKTRSIFWFCQSTYVLFEENIFRYPDPLSWVQYSAQSPVPALVIDRDLKKKAVFVYFHVSSTVTFLVNSKLTKAARAHWYITD